MPLPPNGVEWPPKQMRHITGHMVAWDAWYSGDIDRLVAVYSSYTPTATQQQINRMAQYRGGVQGVVARWFWGQPIPVGPQRTKLHIPIAVDICRAGADLLYAEPPALTVDDDATQQRLDELCDDTLHGVLAESAEIASALGGSYLRVNWDTTVVADKPFLTCVHADAALPEFKYGRLTAVTFWRRIAVVGRQVWRHLERHELAANGNGIILHGLYEGGEAELGRAVPLSDQPDTASLAAMVDQDSAVDTLSPGLAVVYVPNQRPQRRWRSDPIGSNLGVSDLDGVEHLMDALDEAYSSWMRDVRLAKARVFIAESMLDNLGDGKGTAWDVDQEIYAPVNALASRDTKGLPIETFQPEIRWEAHLKTISTLLGDILRTAGYSLQTFGLADSPSGHSAQMTATEVQARERRSYLTRDRKITLQRPQVAAILYKLLLTDQAVFGSAIKPEMPNVGYADSVQESQITLAQTALALRTAEAASTQTLVELVHPDWDEEQVTEEVDRISAEAPPAMPAPTDPFGDPAPADPQTDPNAPAA